MIDNWTCIYGTSLSDSATCSPFHSALRPVARHRRCSGEKMLSLDFAQLQAESVIPEPWSSVHLGALYSDCSSSSSLCCRYRSSLLSEVSKITSCSHNLFQYLYVGVKLYERVRPRRGVDFVTVLIVELLAKNFQFPQGAQNNPKISLEGSATWARSSRKA